MTTCVYMYMFYTQCCIVIETQVKLTREPVGRGLDAIGPITFIMPFTMQRNTKSITGTRLFVMTGLGMQCLFNKANAFKCFFLRPLFLQYSPDDKEISARLSLYSQIPRRHHLGANLRQESLSLFRRARPESRVSRDDRPQERDASSGKCRSQRFESPHRCLSPMSPEPR